MQAGWGEGGHHDKVNATNAQSFLSNNIVESENRLDCSCYLSCSRKQLKQKIKCKLLYNKRKKKKKNSKFVLKWLLFTSKTLSAAAIYFIKHSNSLAYLFYFLFIILLLYINIKQKKMDSQPLDCF